MKKKEIKYEKNIKNNKLELIKNYIEKTKENLNKNKSKSKEKEISKKRIG
jgi:hypothetical protein